MKALTTKVVFDRKNVADNTKSKGLVQIEVIYERKQLFISTGIKLFKNQWDKTRMQIKQSLSMNEYNDTITNLLNKVQEYYNSCVDNSTVFTFDGLKASLSSSNDDDFISFAQKRIKERGDIRDSSRRAQMAGLETIKKFGRIKRFPDITLGNITLFDDYLHGLYDRQTTIWGKHKVLKTYINEAIVFDLVKDNPYRKFKVSRGETRPNMYVEEEDIKKLLKVKKLPVYLDKVRDLIVVQFYTGLSVSDLMSFDSSKIDTVDGQRVLIDKRIKTGVTYTAVIFDVIQDILDKYDGKLPKLSQQKYNEYMKLCFSYAKVDLPDVSSHWLRRGFGMWALNNGAPIEVVSRALGHSSISITEKAYAKVLSKTVITAITKIKR